MSDKFDVLAIGNAIVDVIVRQDDSFLAAREIPKGSMRLISAEQAIKLYEELGLGREVSGGSAANTIVGVSMLGQRGAFIGRVTNDQMGRAFINDIRDVGVHYDTPPAEGGRPTGQCLVIVTPDAQRTMNTYLGSCQELDETDIDEALVRASDITFFEGYLWDLEPSIRALRKTMAIARDAGRQVAMTLSDVFCVEGHRQDFHDLLATDLDIVFANEAEAKSMFETDDVADAIAGFAATGKLCVITRSEKGAVVVRGSVHVEVPAIQLEQVLDTTGAGDLFAAGFLTGFSEGRKLEDCARMGTIAAADVIQHFGARPEKGLKGRVAALLG